MEKKRISIWFSGWYSVGVIACDALAFSLLWCAGYIVRAELDPLFIKMLGRQIQHISPYLRAIPIFTTLWIIICAYHGQYLPRGSVSSLNNLSNILRMFFWGIVAMLALAFLVKHLDLGRSVIIISSLLILFYVYISRTFLRYIKRREYQRGRALYNTLIVGSGDVARKAIDQIIEHPESGFKVVGIVDDVLQTGDQFEGIPVQGHTDDLPELIQHHNVEEVFITQPSLSQEDIINLVVKCEATHANFNIISNIFGVITSQVKFDEIDEVPVIKLQNGHLSPSHAVAKRSFDLIVASLMLIPALIASFFIALLIKIDSRGPVLFTHLRVGKNAKTFTLYKFRTMKLTTEPYEEAPLDPEDPRITRVGKFLRKTSLDETPQLINVFKGNMSIVGPRPEMPFLVERYKEWEKRRLSVKPGITGLWQVVGRKNLPLYMNMEYDFYYIKNQSILMDVVILLKTIPAVLFGKGAF